MITLLYLIVSCQNFDAKYKIKMWRAAPGHEKTATSQSFRSIKDELAAALIANNMVKIKDILMEYPQLKDIEIVKYPNKDHKDKEHIGTPLTFSIQEENDQLLDLLISLNVDIEASDSDGFNATMLAARKGNSGLVEKLHKAGAQLTARNSSGKTILMLAAAKSRWGTMEYLFQHQEVLDNIDATDIHNKSALSESIYNGDLGVFQKLHQAGAKLSIDGCRISTSIFQTIKATMYKKQERIPTLLNMLDYVSNQSKISKKFKKITDKETDQIELWLDRTKIDFGSDITSYLDILDVVTAKIIHSETISKNKKLGAKYLHLYDRLQEKYGRNFN